MRLIPVVKTMLAGLVGAVALGSCLVTFSLSRLEAGLDRNVTAALALTETQVAILDRNTAITEMVAITERISAGMNRLQGHSQSIAAEIGAVGLANRSTLQTNTWLEAQSGQSADDLRRVLRSLQQMNASASSIRDYLTVLRDTAAVDADRLRSIGATTARMNARTPGW